MNEEEKKAIDRIDTIQDLIIEYGQYNADIEDMEYFSKILNLIEKQSKEIKELKKEYERVRAGRNWLSEHISAQIATPELFDRLMEENYISKDKIKEKIKEYKEKKDKSDIQILYTMYLNYIDALKELLKEE